MEWVCVSWHGMCPSPPSCSVPPPSLPPPPPPPSAPSLQNKTRQCAPSPSACQHEPLHVPPLGPPQPQDTLLGQHVQADGVDALLVDQAEGLAAAGGTHLWGGGVCVKGGGRRSVGCVCSFFLDFDCPIHTAPPPPASPSQLISKQPVRLANCATNWNTPRPPPILPPPPSPPYPPS